MCFTDGSAYLNLSGGPAQVQRKAVTWFTSIISKDFFLIHSKTQTFDSKGIILIQLYFQISIYFLGVWTCHQLKDLLKINRLKIFKLFEQSCFKGSYRHLINTQGHKSHHDFPTDWAVGDFQKFYYYLSKILQYPSGSTDSQALERSVDRAQYGVGGLWFTLERWPSCPKSPESPIDAKWAPSLVIPSVI